MDAFDPYRKQIRHALAELLEWGKRKREAEQRMAKLRTLITANANMLPDQEREQLIGQAVESSASGITDSIRSVFRLAYPKGLTPVQVRDKLSAIGFDLTSQSNPMASIHSVIRRLLSGHEIEPFGDASFGGYRWKHSNPLAGLTGRARNLTPFDSPPPKGRVIRRVLPHIDSTVLPDIFPNEEE